MGVRTHPERLAARDGYFSPESVVRRLGNSTVIRFSAAALPFCCRSRIRWSRTTERLGALEVDLLLTIEQDTA
jgi:hypothetical protein